MKAAPSALTELGLALSLVGISCAPVAGPGSDRAAVKRGAAKGGKPQAVNSTALGPLQVNKWRFDNGLTVILAPDPAATSVSYMTWYRVGSRHENAAAGETGLAHLFEHLMFTQTKSAREPGAFDARMEEVGGNVNAMTSYDFTAYVDNLPPDALPLAVEMEADRMVNLALRDEQVTTEREVVAEERLGAVEDNVDGLLDETLYAQAFKSHPYRFPVIGLMKDIRAVTRAKATRFYRTYYAPNNAVIVVTGRFDEQQALALLTQHYGPLPASPDLPADTVRSERAPAAEVRSELVRPVPGDRFVIGYPAPALAHADRAAYDVIDELLTGGPSSRLHRRLVIEDELASSVDGNVAPTKDAGLYGLWVQMIRPHAAEAADRIIVAELERLRREPVGDEELAKARNKLETAFWQGLTSSEGRAEQLGEFEVVAGDHRRLIERAAAYAKVTAADVQRVATAYLGPARSVVVARPTP